MRLLFLSIFAILAACVAPPSDTVEKRYIVVGDESLDLGSEILAVGGTPERDLAAVHTCTAMLTADAASELMARDGVLIVEEDRIVSLGKPEKCPGFPNCEGDGGGEDPPPAPSSQSTPWGIVQTGADTVSVTGAGIKVVINDTGIDPNHPDLDVVDGINFSSRRRGKWKDDNGHGTHVAGTVAALDNTTDVVGMAPDALLYACKSLDRNGSGWMSNIISCIDWAVTQDADVLNMSLGASSGSNALQSACNDAREAGVLLAVAAGNSGDGDPNTDDVGYPAQYASTFAVGATDQSDNPTYFTSDGDAVDVAAPGLDIESTKLGGGTVEYSGTSMASPHVAGAMALLLEAGFSADCVEIALQATADDVWTPDFDVFTGSGRINVPAALDYGCPQ